MFVLFFFEGGVLLEDADGILLFDDVLFEAIHIFGDRFNEAFFLLKFELKLLGPLLQLQGDMLDLLILFAHYAVNPFLVIFKDLLLFLDLDVLLVHLFPVLPILLHLLPQLLYRMPLLLIYLQLQVQLFVQLFFLIVNFSNCSFVSLVEFSLVAQFDFKFFRFVGEDAFVDEVFFEFSFIFVPHHSLSGAFFLHARSKRLQFSPRILHLQKLLLEAVILFLQ